ncbi:unnamed protein product [Penicillium nalgiovense]|nr:unnamed protein product [Penicillium nalgiovense]CAG8262731.1 unnamed protein product [Penicillium nalgiovense]
MFFNKWIFAIAIVALANVVIAVQTPACVLKVIGQQPNPADSKAICGSDASKIQSTISKNCADSEASLKFFVNNCAQLGHKVVSTATGTSETSTATGFVTATQTGSSAVATGTGTSTSAAAGTSEVSTGTASESGAAASPTSTFNAASSDRQLSTTFVAAVFLGAAALL